MVRKKNVRTERPLNEVFGEIVHTHESFGVKQIATLLDESIHTVNAWMQGRNRVPAEIAVRLAVELGDNRMMHWLASRAGGVYTPSAEHQASVYDLPAFFRASTKTMSVAAEALADGRVSDDEVCDLEKALVEQEAASRGLLSLVRELRGRASDGRASTLSGADPANVIRGGF